MLRGTFADGGMEIYPSDERKVFAFNTIAIPDTEKAVEHLKNTQLEDDKLINIVFCKTEKGNFVSFTIHHFENWNHISQFFFKILNQLFF